MTYVPLRAGDAAARVLRHFKTAEVYDELADVYDDRYRTPECDRENHYVAGQIKKVCPPREKLRVLDIGAGTGLAIELGVTAYPHGYLAIDPSEKMLTRLLEKYPAASVINDRAAGIPNDTKFNLGLALFGTASYCTPGELRHIAWLTERNFASTILMTYAKDYYPDYYDEPPATAKDATDTLIQIGTYLGTMNRKYDLWLLR